MQNRSSSEKPEDLRREERHVGPRFDAHGGIAVPYRSRTFADGYRLGLDVGACFNYPIVGPVGVATRLFLEPSYEVTRTASGDTHRLPARIGLAFER